MPDTTRTHTPAAMRKSWFEAMTGFPEGTYDETRAKLRVEGTKLVSSGLRHDIGEFEFPTLAELRERVAAASSAQAQGKGSQTPLVLGEVIGSVGRFHQQSQYSGALFQAASQFNVLEMVSPRVTPEEGVTIYAHDHTQGPACAIACGAATVYRNYLVPIDAEGRMDPSPTPFQVGQTKDLQLNGLVEVGKELVKALPGYNSVGELWKMCNGYALCSERGLRDIAAHLDKVGEEEKDRLRSLLRVGIHWEAEVTSASSSSSDSPSGAAPRVSQIFSSALPVAYSDVNDTALWAPFARLVLEAAYEATILAGVLNMQRGGGSNIVLLTRLGGK